jgi:hypothetical protein
VPFSLKKGKEMKELRKKGKYKRKERRKEEE